MMAEKQIMGHIDCPTCGTVGGMRVTADKNGHPFGFCTATCGQQLRVGPDPDRIRRFLSRHAAKLAPPAAPAPAAAPAAPAPAPAAPAARKPARHESLTNALAFLGVGVAP